MTQNTATTQNTTKQDLTKQNAKLLRRAMQQPDDLVVELDYMDCYGRHRRRVVSPIRFTTTDNFLALCLCREELRNFNISRCRNLRLRWAIDVQMPVPFAEPMTPVGRGKTRQHRTIAPSPASDSATPNPVPIASL